MKKIYSLISVILILSLILSGCNKSTKENGTSDLSTSSVETTSGMTSSADSDNKPVTTNPVVTSDTSTDGTGDADSDSRKTTLGDIFSIINSTEEVTTTKEDISGSTYDYFEAPSSEAEISLVDGGVYYTGGSVASDDSYTPSYAPDVYTTDIISFDSFTTDEYIPDYASDAVISEAYVADDYAGADFVISDPIIIDDPIAPYEPITPIDPTEPIIIDDPIVADPIIDEPIIIDDPIIDPIIIDDPIIEPIIEPEPYVDPMAGLLTAGEWNDNLHFDFLKALLKNGQDYNYSSFFTDWGLSPFNRIALKITDSANNALTNASVQLTDASGSVLWTSRTDNNGYAYCFYNLNGSSSVPAYALVSYTSADGSMASTTYELPGSALLDDAVTTIALDTTVNRTKTLDLMFVVDTTGSMGDEITYLQAELEDVVTRVKNGNANIPTRLSVNFYRDLEDDYVVRSYPFSSNIDEQLKYLRIEYANGGGDYEEAVEMAIDDAINNHSWDENSIKIMFMVLDAPPHNTQAVRSSLATSIEQAAAMGIHIIPIASSGVDKSTEFLLRTLAMTTGGTYTFLTDDSGIGGSHLEPTVGSYEVENLNDMLVRIINSYLK